MYYELFAKKISELESLLKKNRAVQHSSVHQESFSKMKNNLVAEIISLIKDAPIKKALVPEYLKLKKMNQLEILQALWKAENAGYITFELWSLLMDLEVAAFQGNLLEVTNLLENDDLKAIAASNSNCVLRIAALQNQQTLIEYLLFIESIRYVANHVPLIKSQAEVSAVARLTSFLNTAKNFEKEASAYFQSIKELLSAGNITDLDWKLLPLVLSFEKVPSALLKEVVSFITVMPSVRLRAQQDADFSELLFQTKQWLKNNSAKPCPQDVPRIGPHIVKLGVSTFNLLAYEKFLEEKAYKDKLREHFTESYLEKHCPERFPPKAPTDIYHSITIQNSKVRYNGVRRGKIK